MSNVELEVALQAVVDMQLELSAKEKDIQRLQTNLDELNSAAGTWQQQEVANQVAWDMREQEWGLERERLIEENRKLKETIVQQAVQGTAPTNHHRPPASPKQLSDMLGQMIFKANEERS